MGLREILYVASRVPGAFVNARHVRQFDGRVNMLARLGEHGFIKYQAAPAHVQDAARYLLNEPRAVLDERLLPLLRYLVDLVRADVVEYLGADVRMDNAQISRVPRSEAGFASVSGSWHNDGVGHRLKLYYCIQGEGDVPTALIAGSHRRPYSPTLSDFKRHIGSEDMTSKESDVLLRHRTGDCTIFDTNAQHRGTYEGRHAARTVLEIEFADRRKSDALTGQAAIGPGNTGIPQLHVLKEIGDTLSDELLLDRALFKPISETMYSYG